MASCQIRKASCAKPLAVLRSMFVYEQFACQLRGCPGIVAGVGDARPAVRGPAAGRGAPIVVVWERAPPARGGSLPTAHGAPSLPRRTPQPLLGSLACTHAGLHAYGAGKRVPYFPCHSPGSIAAPFGRCLPIRTPILYLSSPFPQGPGCGPIECPVGRPGIGPRGGRALWPAALLGWDTVVVPRGGRCGRRLRVAS